MSDTRPKAGDRLQHHSVPGVYTVEAVMFDGRVVVIDPRGERQRLWPSYMRENFRPASPDNPETESRSE